MNNKFINEYFNTYDRFSYYNPNYINLISENENFLRNSYNSLTDNRPTLRFGDRGESVMQLQKKLITLNYLQGQPDGIFGRNTEQAVRNFQKDFGLLEDGIVGNSTWSAIERVLNEPIPTNRPQVKKGDKNVFVNTLQLRLIKLGFFDGDPNGIFDDNTEEAVIRFQQSQNLQADGIVGPNTWRAIDRSFSATEKPMPSLKQTISIGDSGDDVMLLQRMLTALNYYHDEINGIFDDNTEEAVRRFQIDSNLLVNGIVDQLNWETLENLIIYPNSNLKEGDTGNDVIILQEKLKLLDYFPGSITSSFGAETTDAVKQFQKNKTIPETGIVTESTWEELYKDTKKLEPQIPFSVLDKPTLRLGSSGESVKELQRLLTQLMFYNGEIDGVFGNSTNVAVRAFQTNNKLTADGVVGRNTWSALIYLYSPLAICGGTTTDFIGVVIDPGHGGTDPGAVSSAIIEKEYTLKISQYMSNRFRELGVPFAITRSTDETLSNTERVRRMKEPFGDVKNAIVISNHINAGGGEGAEVIYALRNTDALASSILSEIGKAGQITRRVYQKTLPSDPTKDYYYIMRDTNNLQTTIVEYGFLDNTNDVLRLQKYWDKYAEATVKAVTEYMGYKYVVPTSGKITYIVVAGDSLWSIANRFNTTVAAIKTLNNLTSDVLSIGQQLFIPGEETPSGNIVYIVVAGDSLWSIANRFNTTVAAIKTLNNLTSDVLSIGQQLFIPGVSIDIPETSPTVYTVQAGDSLWIIANRFNTTVASLKRWNNLTSDVIIVGQRLIVSNIGNQQYTFHTVQAGDSLWIIANRFNTTVAAIKTLNNLTSDVLSIGQILIVPKS